MQVFGTMSDNSPAFPFVSGREGVDSIVETMRLGALDFIRKPFDAKTIQTSVNEALQFRELQVGLERRKRRRSSSSGSPW